MAVESEPAAATEVEAEVVAVEEPEQPLGHFLLFFSYFGLGRVTRKRLKGLLPEQTIRWTIS